MSEIKVNSIKGVGASAAAITVDNSSGSCAANITSLNGGQFANRNIILNGEFLVSQRASSATSVAGNGGFSYDTVDRFVYGRSTDAVVNLAQEDDAPLGFKKCLQVRVTTAATSTSYARIVYRIEDTDVYRFGFGQSGTRFLTLSFYHKHTQAGTNCVMIQNPSYNRSYIAEYTQSVANTWERATITFPVDTGNHWSPSGGRGMQIQWGLTNADSVGSANAWTSSNIVVTSNQYNHLGAVDNYFRLTGVQLEVGSVATDFEHRSFGQELALCQRYFYQYVDGSEYTSGIASLCNVIAYQDNNVFGTVEFPVTMRGKPTLVHVEGTNYFKIYRNAGSGDLNALQLQASGKNGANINAYSATSGVSISQDQGGFMLSNDTGVRIGFSAEL